MQIIVGCVDAEPKSVVSQLFHRNKFEFGKKINAKCRILIHLLFTIRLKRRSRSTFPQYIALRRDRPCHIRTWIYESLHLETIWVGSGGSAHHLVIMHVKLNLF